MKAWLGKLLFHVHKHKFYMVEWDRQRLGPDVTDMTDMTALYHNLYKCACGEEKVVNGRGYI